MRLLFDQNLSPRLVEPLSDIFQGSEHVYKLKLDQAKDVAVWEHARQNNYIIVSEDADFSELSMTHGFPPKVIWIRRGNCTTKEISYILRNNYSQIEELYNNNTVGLLLLY